MFTILSGVGLWLTISIKVLKFNAKIRRKIVFYLKGTNDLTYLKNRLKLGLKFEFQLTLRGALKTFRLCHETII